MKRTGDVMRAIATLVFLTLAAQFAGCAAHPDPIIDTQGVDMDEYAQDWNECEAYTDEVLVTRGIAKGAATGAAIGAVAGAIDGEVGENATLGGLYGGTRSGLDADRQKQLVFKRCMSGRGYRVLN